MKKTLNKFLNSYTNFLYMSEFANNTRLGVMAASAMALAVWYDLFVIPAVLFLFSKKESWYSGFQRDLEKVRGTKDEKTRGQKTENGKANP